MNSDFNGMEMLRQFDAAVEAEMRDWGIGGVAAALTDGQRLVLCRGYGEAERDSVFRAGSISKLFNAVAVMQLVEKGTWTLDDPFEALPGAVLPVNPFPDAPPITLRRMLCHRSGMQREAPVGGYLDDSEPSVAGACESIRGCAVVTPPGAKTRYSNIVPTLTGRAVEVATGEDFAAYQGRHILGRLGMQRSGWRRHETPGKEVLVSRMRVADGCGNYRREETPLFDLGTLPAGNLFTTAPDLAEFLFMLDGKGTGRAGRILSERSLGEMTQLQDDPDADCGFGVGFALGRFYDHRAIGHTGAVYGHSTSLLYLPDLRLGIVVLANEDIVPGRVGRLANLGLTMLAEAKTGKVYRRQAVDCVVKGDVRRFAGSYESQSFWCDLTACENRLDGSLSGQPCRMTPMSDGSFRLRSRLHDDVVVTFSENGFTAGIQRFVRIDPSTRSIPEDWRRLLGSFGPRSIPVVVREKWGRLYATTENMVDYRLTPQSRHVFRLPAGMYEDEGVAFLPRVDGTIHAVDFASMVLPRLAL